MATKKKVDSPDPLTDTGKQRRAIAAKNVMNRAYLNAIVYIFLAGVMGSGMILYLRPESDPVVVVPIALALAGTTIFSLLGFIRSQESAVLVQKNTTITEETKSLAIESRHTMNSKLDIMLEIIKEGYEARGFVKGQKAAEDRADKITQDKASGRKLAKASK